MRATLSLSFDNLGEAAEIEVGARDPDAPLGGHPSATEAAPAILKALAAAGLSATFFLEGLNAEAYPELLAEIDGAGHEVAYHAWRHERWGALSAAQQAENLSRGLAALGELGLQPSGMRPPGGELGAGGVAVLREAGLRYCSPEGEAAAVDGGDFAMLPFRWRHVDAACVLPDLGPAREPDRFLADLEEDLDVLERDGGHLALVLHPFMLDWLGEERLAGLLGGLAGRRDAGRLRVGRCEEAAEALLSAP
jgi:peptidoglycan/xylan/chitin deacetylase (PgdA/CDA1 family)